MGGERKPKITWGAPEPLTKHVGERDAGSNAGGGEQKQEVSTVEKKQAELKELYERKADEIAMSPTKQFFPTMMMLWMAGSQVSIFSIMFTAMAIMNPMKVRASAVCCCCCWRCCC